MARAALTSLLHYLHLLGPGPEGEGQGDDRLLERFTRDGDESAFAALVGRHGPMVWGVCARLLAPPDAEDAFQATFLVLVKKARSLRDPGRLGAWLHGVACRTALKARARVARQRAGRQPLAEPAAPEATSDLVWREVRGVLDEEVERLPERYRRPVVLCYLEGLTNEEAARRLDCPKGTVLSRLARARDRLRQRLRRRGLDLSAAALAAGLATSAATAAPPDLISSTARFGLSTAAGGVAPAVTARVTALAEGVIHAMFLHKLKLAAVALLALTLLGPGVWFAHHSLAGPPLPPPTKIPGGDKADEPAKPKAGDKPAPAGKTTTLLEKRVDLAEKCYQSAFDGLSQTKRMGNVLVMKTLGPEEVYVWSVRWLQAQHDLSPKPADRIAACQAHLERMTKLKKAVEPLTRDLIPRIKLDEAEWYRLEAELWLAKAKAAAAKAK